MTEAGWLACNDPVALLEVVLGRASPRQLRLFLCACYRRSWDEIRPHVRDAVDLVERFADGFVSREDIEGSFPFNLGLMMQHEPIRQLVNDKLPNGFLTMFRLEFAVLAPHRWRADCVSIRDIFDNPFHPIAVDRAWLTPDVLSLAQAAYEERVLPSGELDRIRLSILADALEDAGCTDDALLSHLRSPGPHVRGCWAVDLLLGRM